MNESAIQKNSSSQLINRLLYIGFLVLGSFMVFRHDWGTAMANLGIALAFDPFNQHQAFGQRPLYQRIWLVVHVSLVIALLGLVISGLIQTNL